MPMKNCLLAVLVYGNAVLAEEPPFCEQARQYHESAGGQTLVILQDGKVICENYANGGSADAPQMLASGSKSFVGIAALAAIEDGLIQLDECVSDTLPEWKNDPVKSKITCRQLLTLTSGLTAGERGAAMNSPAWKEIIAKPMSGKPGEQFEYGAYHLIAFCEALQRKLGNESFEAYLKRRVLDPIGITVKWQGRCADGNPQVGGGAHLTARDWATFGQFVLNNGEWNGKQIIRAGLFDLVKQGTPQNPAYGLTWWLKKDVPDSIVAQVPILQRDMGDIVQSDWLPEDLFMAAGAGKQRLYIIPSMKLVVARQGPMSAANRFSDAEFLSRLLRDVPLEK
jgi:CubicO group peptidase (beta-lactamase class C family)